MSLALRAQHEQLRHLTRTDPHPRVRRRAHALLLLAEGHSVAVLAVPGRRASGLADEPRTGRPPKLDATARAFLEEALEARPQACGLPVTIWSVRDLRDALAHRLGIRVCTTTVLRAMQRLGYRYRRPRHDLTHRQDHEAIAATTEVLAWLRKKALTPPATFVWSTSMSARSTGIPAWQECGNGQSVR